MRLTVANCFKSTLHCMTSNLKFVPKHDPVVEKDIKMLENFLINKPKILVLTGAGISTESGKWILSVVISPMYFLFNNK